MGNQHGVYKGSIGRINPHEGREYYMRIYVHMSADEAKAEKKAIEEGGEREDLSRYLLCFRFSQPTKCRYESNRYPIPFELPADTPNPNASRGTRAFPQRKEGCTG